MGLLCKPSTGGTISSLIHHSSWLTAIVPMDGCQVLDVYVGGSLTKHPFSFLILLPLTASP